MTVASGAALRRNAALSVLAGALWFLSCANFDVWPLAWFAMVPALLVIERVETTLGAFAFAWLTGIVTHGGGFYWIVGLLTRFAHLPWLLSALLFVLLMAYQGLVFGLFGVVVRVVRRNESLPMALVAPVVFVTCEFAVPLLFPASIAMSQAWQPHVIQVADLGGMPLVAALLLMINGAIYDVLIARPRRVRSAVTSAVVLGAALVYGQWRLGQVDARRAAAPHLNVGVVQPNLSFDMKGANRVAFAARQRHDLEEQSQSLEASGAELVVWPETAFPYFVERDATADLPPGDTHRVREGFSAPVLFGAVSVARVPNARAQYWNTAFLLDRAGSFAGRYDKMHRMLFSEYLPGRDRIAWLDRMLRNVAAQFERGNGVTTFAVRTADDRVWRVAPVICYEDILEGFTRDVGALHPHLLVNITNDSWFGDTSEPWEHLALSVFGAVELRTDLVRSVNTGVSAFVDAAGRVYAKTYAVNPMEHPVGADHLQARVALLEGGNTVYARVGNLFAYLCVAITVFCALVLPRLRRVPRSAR